VEAAAVLDAEVEQAPELVAGADGAAGAVLDVHVQVDAGVGLARPGEEALAVGLDQAHLRVHDLDLVAPRHLAQVGEQPVQALALAQQRADGIGRAPLGGAAPVDFAVVALGVGRHLRFVRPVELAVGRLVVRDEAREGFGLVRVRQVQDLEPVALGQAAALVRRRRVGGGRAVADQHAAGEEVGRLVVHGEQELAHDVAGARLLLEHAGEARGAAQLGGALELPARREAQREGGDEAEQAVAADGEAEQLRVLGAAALRQPAVGEQQAEGVEVGDEGRGAQAPAVEVRRQAAAEGHAVGAGLLLREGPRPLAPGLRLGQVPGELRPLDAGLDLDMAALGVEADDAVELARVDQHAVLGEGLPAHGVAAAGDAYRLFLGLRLLEGLLHAVEVGGLHHGVHARRAELRMHVVHQDGGRGLRLGGGLCLGRRLPQGERGPGRGQACCANEVAPAGHGR
jgi:hypothetical protein